MDQIQLGGTLEWRDHLRAQHLHMRPRRPFAVVGIALITLAVALIVYGICVAKITHFSIYLILLGLVYLGLFFGLFMPWRSRRIFRQQVALHSPFELIATSDGFASKNEFSESRVPWSVFVKWKENRHLFLLYQSSVLFNMVPKRLFPDESSTVQFREWLSGQVQRAG